MANVDLGPAISWGCPSCRAPLSEQDICGRCGEPAAPALTLATILGHAVAIGDIEATESGRPSRPGVSRLLRAVGQRTPYYRRAWRMLLTDWIYGHHLGRQVAQDERTAEASKAAKGGRRG